MPGLFDRLQDEINAQEQHSNLSPIDLLDLPDGLADIIKKIVRQNGMKLTDIATDLQQTPAEVQTTMDGLADKGLVRRVEVRKEVWYKANFGRKISQPKGDVDSVWASLDNMLGTDDAK